MPWYAAHIVMRIRYRHGPPEPHYLMENVVLIEAPDTAEARRLAELHGRSDSNEDDLTFRCDDRPAYWAFAGVRVLVDCHDPDTQPKSGTEVTYFEYRAASAEDVDSRLAGRTANVEFG